MMKIKLPLFLLMAIVMTVVAPLTVAAADEFFIKEVVVNEVSVLERVNTGDIVDPDEIVAETGQTLFITVELEALLDTEDVSIEAEIRGVEAGTLEQETSLFDIKEGKTYVKFLTLRIPSDIRLNEDITDDFKLRIRATSDDDEDTDNVPLTVDRVRHGLVVLDVQTPMEAKAGETALIEVVARNRGSKVEEDVFVKAEVAELSTSRQKFLGDLLPLEDWKNEDNELSDKGLAFIRLEVPKGAETGDYALRVTAYTLDGVALGEEVMTLSVNGRDVMPADSAAVVVDASSKSVAREQGVVYKISVTNLGESTQTYTAEAFGINFGTSSVNPSAITLTEGSSGEFNVFVSPEETATLGSHTFNVVVRSGSETVNTLSLNAEVTGDDSSDEGRLRSSLIVIAVILVVILIVLAIIIAVVTGRRSEESEEKLY